MHDISPKTDKILVVGSGFAGAIIARQLADLSGKKIDVIDSRDHIGGNSFSRRDQDTGIMEHVYGPHIFNTNHADVYNYVQKFADWEPYTNRVKARNSHGVFSMPINLHTINQYFRKQLNPEEARLFIQQRAIKYEKPPANFEEQALSMIGMELYETFIYGYTKKQWGCEPKKLPAEIIKRLPVRFNYNDNFYNSRYQLMPRNGYGDLFKKILSHPNISISLNHNFQLDMINDYSNVVYTGCIDRFFNYRYGQLGYRTVEFEKHTESGDYQGNAVINYTEEAPAFTRVHEHKHFSPWESHEKTIVVTETSKETSTDDVPFYPKRLPADLEALTKYQMLKNEYPTVSFVGRLGTYRYLDMDQVIGESLDFSNIWVQTGKMPASCNPRPKAV